MGLGLGFGFGLGLGVQVRNEGQRPRTTDLVVILSSHVVFCGSLVLPCGGVVMLFYVLVVVLCLGLGLGRRRLVGSCRKGEDKLSFIVIYNCGNETVRFST